MWKLDGLKRWWTKVTRRNLYGTPVRVSEVPFLTAEGRREINPSLLYFEFVDDAGKINPVLITDYEYACMCARAKTHRLKIANLDMECLDNATKEKEQND